MSTTEPKQRLAPDEVAPHGWVIERPSYYGAGSETFLMVGKTCYVPAPCPPRTWTGTVEALWDEKHEVLEWPGLMRITVTEVTEKQGERP